MKVKVKSAPDQKYFGTFGKDEAAEAKNSSNKHEGRHKNHRLSNVHLENNKSLAVFLILPIGFEDIIFRYKILPLRFMRCFCPLRPVRKVKW